MDEPRWVRSGRGLILFLIVAIGVSFIVAVLQSPASLVMKTIAIVGIGAICAGGFIRIWLASRPYGLGAWDQRNDPGKPTGHSG